MKARLVELRARRARLVAQAAAEREEIAASLAAWRVPLEVADIGMSAVRYLRSRAGLLAFAGLVVVTLAPQRAARWARRGLLVLQSFRLALATLRELRGGKGRAT
jgi:hypothetical protein